MRHKKYTNETSKKQRVHDWDLLELASGKNTEDAVECDKDSTSQALLSLRKQTSSNMLIQECFCEGIFFLSECVQVHRAWGGGGGFWDGEVFPREIKLGRGVLGFGVPGRSPTPPPPPIRNGLQSRQTNWQSHQRGACTSFLLCSRTSTINGLFALLVGSLST